MPSFVVDSSFKKVADVAMYSTSRDVVHCFECFRGDAVEAWCFSLFQFVYGAFYFCKTNRASGQGGPGQYGLLVDGC